MNEFEVKKVRLKDKDVKRLYYLCFNKKDRLPFFWMIIMPKLLFTKFFAFYIENKLIGFIYYNVSISHVFLMFFGVCPNLRNKGYGSKILSYIKNKYPKKCIISSFNSNDINSANKRRNFYQNNDFTLCPKDMIFLFHRQELMVCNNKLHKFRFFIFMLFYSCLVIWVIFVKHKEINHI